VTRMINNPEQKSTKEFFRRYLGDIQQIASAREFILTGGKAEGVRGIDIRTGAGLRYTVLPGRGMDIADLTYRGVPLHYFSATGITSPGYFEEQDYRSMRGFYGGLLTTCGLSNAGWPGEDQGKAYGLHGRVSNSGAEDVAVRQCWDEDEYVISARGVLRDASFRGENLRMERTIISKLSVPEFEITDVIENLGYQPEPLMMIYHINFGYPLLSPETEILAPIISTRGYDEISDSYESKSSWNRFSEASLSPARRLYQHDCGASENGKTFFAVINRKLKPLGFLGIAVEYNKAELPELTQFKVCEAGSYICSLEPGNVTVHGRGALRKQNRLPMLGPSETKTIKMKFSIINDEDGLSRLEEAVLKSVGN
jgi:hypothetical protein